MTPRVCIIVVCALALLAVTVNAAARPKVILGEDPAEGGEPYPSAVMTALQQYVATPDENYQWTYHPEFDAKGLGYTVLWLNMTSQRWLTDADVSRSLWQHWVGVVVPNTLNPAFSEYGLEWIGGGHNNVNHPPTIWDKDLIVVAALAQELGAIVASVYSIPNEPMLYYAEQPKPKSRTEDAMIAWAWQHFLQDTSNPEWLPRLPMTKAAIRGMDAASEFWQQRTGNSMSSWLVAGASKRGWTTWTVGACDPERVVAIIPMVLDELNFVQNIKHHYRAYGGWSFALTDYYALNFTAQLDTPEVAQMMEIIDPINYVNILTMPKLIISTAGDEFLCLDNNDWYWSQLQGEKHFHSFPNLEHTMMENIPAVIETVRGFAVQIMSGTPRPDYIWSKSQNGTITLEINSANPPSKVQLWQALTIDGNLRRDFRLVAIMNTTEGMKPWLHPVFWKGSDLAPASTTPGLITYQAYVEPPQEGWVGFVIEAEFPIAGTNATFRISTAQSILPQTFPFPECEGEECMGTLV